MSIKIIHTADNHIGISYNTVSQAKTELVKERLDSLKRIVEEGNKELANYLVIAGDLFDLPKLNKSKTTEVIKILKSFIIFNRFGKMVFQTNDITKGWVGKYNGYDQEMDAYSYLIDYETYKDVSLRKTGSFILMR